MKIKTFIISLISSLMIISTVQADTGAVFERIKSTNTINCGYAEWPQFFDVDPNSGEFSGFFHDFWAQVGQDLNTKIEWKLPIQWGQVTEAVATKKIDIFCNGAWPDSGKRRNLLLSDPVFYTPLYAYARIDDDRFNDNDLSALNDKDVKGVAIDGDATEPILKKNFPSVERIMFPAATPTSDLILSVVTGKADFIVMDEPEINAFTANNPGKIKKVSDKPVVLNQVVTPFAMGEEHLMNAFNSILTDLINDGTVDHLIKKHNIEGVITPSEL